MDVLHRYTKNLRVYHKEWMKITNEQKEAAAAAADGSLPSLCDAALATSLPSSSSSTNFRPFFEWLDCPSNKHKVDLPECPRALLDRDTVHYCSDAAERQQYALFIDPTTGLVHRAATGQLVTTSLAGAGTGVAGAGMGAAGEIFVLRDDVLYSAVMM